MFRPLQKHTNPTHTVAGLWPDCRLETNPHCWRQTVVGRQHSSRIGFSVAADINSNVVDIYCLVWSLSRLLYCVGSGSKVAATFRRMSAADRVLRFGVRILPGTWIFVCCECCVLSRRGICDELITCPEESYRLWRVVRCNLGTSRIRRPWPQLGCSARGRRNIRNGVHWITLTPNKRH
jgi:hypothetical protein